MTIKEASDLLSIIEVNDGKLDTHTHWGSFDDDMKEALKFAIKGLKSLEAWELVKNEVKELSEIDHDGDHFDDCKFDVLKIINKHLKEVENAI